MRTVAIIGAGPAGLCAARYLKSEGFEPVIFEQGDSMGGQWSGHASRSGVWPAMRTNTSRIMSSFSDMAHPAGTSTYPTNQAMKSYLERYAEMFDLASRIRLASPVVGLRSDGDAGWMIRTENREEAFPYVVMASGRYNFPSIPDVPGLASFSGSGGLKHTFAYKHPDAYRGLRVLVTGCSISSLEIASDLAMLGAARVVLSSRKQRYVLPKLVGGVPLDHLAFTRFAALAEESFPLAAIGAGLKQFVLSANGSPEQYGAFRPPDDIFEAHLTQSQYFLPLVAEGRIAVKPWIEAVQQTAVRFTDGSVESFDAIVSEPATI